MRSHIEEILMNARFRRFLTLTAASLVFSSTLFVAAQEPAPAPSPQPAVGAPAPAPDPAVGGRRGRGPLPPLGPATEPRPRDDARHQSFLEVAKAGNIDLLFVGDSITDAWRRGEQNKLFKERWGKHNPLNLGIGGDRTQHVLWRLDNGEVDGIKPKVTVLMIGTNNLGNKESAADTILGVKAVVAKLREKLPETKILLLGVFPRTDKPLGGEIKQVNDEISKLDDGGKHVKYLDIGDKFLTNGELTKDVMPDLLHPNAKGYQIWADAIQPTLDEMMK
jgi:lysophospholipase L1-like esterase